MRIRRGRIRREHLTAKSAKAKGQVQKVGPPVGSLAADRFGKDTDFFGQRTNWKVMTRPLIQKGTRFLYSVR